MWSGARCRFVLLRHSYAWRRDPRSGSTLPSAEVLLPPWAPSALEPQPLRRQRVDFPRHRSVRSIPPRDAFRTGSPSQGTGTRRAMNAHRECYVRSALQLYSRRPHCGGAPVRRAPDEHSESKPLLRRGAWARRRSRRHGSGGVGGGCVCAHMYVSGSLCASICPRVRLVFVELRLQRTTAHKMCQCVSAGSTGKAFKHSRREMSSPPETNGHQRPCLPSRFLASFAFLQHVQAYCRSAARRVVSCLPLDLSLESSSEDGVRLQPRRRSHRMLRQGCQ